MFLDVFIHLLSPFWGTYFIVCTNIVVFQFAYIRKDKILLDPTRTMYVLHMPLPVKGHGDSIILIYTCLIENFNWNKVMGFEVRYSLYSLSGQFCTLKELFYICVSPKDVSMRGNLYMICVVGNCPVFTE